MKIRETSLPGSIVIELTRHSDERGYFMELYHKTRLRELGLEQRFVQDNMSFSVHGVLRGLHYQWPNPQGKLVTCLQGKIWDVALDIREGSPTFGQWHAEYLDDESPQSFYIPEGFAHGFCVLSETALVHYKCTDIYRPESDGGIAFDDPDFGIPWPVDHPSLSVKDRALPKYADLAADRRPKF